MNTSVGAPQGNMCRTKTPPNVDQILLDQFLHLSLTICDCTIFNSAFIVNIDQTNIIYQPSNTSTFETTGSKQVSVIGQEEKRAFTVVNGISARGHALPLQLIYEGKTSHSLPSKSTPQYKEAMELKFKISYSSTHTYQSTFPLMCEYVNNILVPYWEEQKVLLDAPADQECVLHLNV